MPVPPTWIARIPEILAIVQQMPAKELDRGEIIELFRLRRRAALLLMKQLEPRMVRGSWRIERSRLASWLAGQMRDSQRELDRRDRMTRALITADDSLSRARGAFLSVTATQDMRSRAAEGLPPGVLLTIGQPSKLEVEFHTLEELAEKLIQAGLALDRNFDHYADLLEFTTEPVVEREKELERMDAEYLKSWNRPGAQ